MIDFRIVGKLLSEARASKHITALELIKRIGIDRPRLERIESGESDFTMSTFLGICHGLDISPVKLLQIANARNLMNYGDDLVLFGKSKVGK